MYAFGSSTPMANTPIANTTRVNSKVIVLVTKSEFEPQSLGLNMSAAYGPRVYSEIRVSARRMEVHTYDHAEDEGPTSFTNVKLHSTSISCNEMNAKRPYPLSEQQGEHAELRKRLMTMNKLRFRLSSSLKRRNHQGMRMQHEE